MKNQNKEHLYTVFCPIHGNRVMSFEAACKYEKAIKISLVRQGYSELASQCKVTYLKTITF